MIAFARLSPACLAGLLVLSGCGSEPARDAEPAPVEAAEQPTLGIHRAFVPGPGSVNGYWLEGEDSILVFDVQRDPEYARRMIAQIEATGKPVEAIIVSHYHPDHFGGLPAFREAFPDAELLTVEAIADQMDEDASEYIATFEEARRAAAAEEANEDTGNEPTEEQADAEAVEELPPFPEFDRMIEDGDELVISGTSVIVDVVREAEAAPTIMLAIPIQRVLFASDLVAADMHPFLTDADIDAWPNALERITRDYSGYRLYPGHGEPGPVQLLAANQIAYLSFMRNLVEDELLDDDEVTESEIRDAIAKIETNYTGWEDVSGRPGYLRRNLVALVEKLGGEVPRAAGEPPEDNQEQDAGS